MSGNARIGHIRQRTPVSYTHLFIISCIRRVSSLTVLMEATPSFFIFSTLMSSLSLDRAFLNSSVSSSELDVYQSQHLNRGPVHRGDL